MEAAEAAATAADTVTAVGAGLTDPRTKSAQSEQHTDLAPFRTPVVIARGLAEGLAITPQAALRLVRHLIAAGDRPGGHRPRRLARLHHGIDRAGESGAGISSPGGASAPPRPFSPARVAPRSSVPGSARRSSPRPPSRGNIHQATTGSARRAWQHDGASASLRITAFHGDAIGVADDRACTEHRHDIWRRAECVGYIDVTTRNPRMTRERHSIFRYAALGKAEPIVVKNVLVIHDQAAAVQLTFCVATTEAARG